MAVAQSAIHANLNRDKVLKDTWWLTYCCCGGQGLGPVSDPLIGSEFKQLCLHGTCMTADIMGDDGLCGQLSVMCCITQHFQLPPLAGAPKVTCFNKPIMPGSGSVPLKDPLFDVPAVFSGTWWLYYLFCFGVGFSGLKADGRPLYAVRAKQIIARSGVDLVPPIEDGILCSGIGTQFCFWSQNQFPPAKENNPMIACCGWRKNKVGGGSPGQVEMK